MSRRVLSKSDVTSDEGMALLGAGARQPGHTSDPLSARDPEKSLKKFDNGLFVPFIGKILVPEIKNHVLPRRRLLDQVHRGLQRRITTVCAPAGYGKTTLAATFVADAELPACWYSLDENDTDPLRFIEYLVAALRLRFPGVGSRTLAALHGEDHDLAFLVGTLVTEVYSEVPEAFLFVLDDVHVTAGKPAAATLDSFLLQAPEHCRILLLSRTPIVLPSLPRLTAGREVSRLTTADLAFTRDEGAQLLEVLGVTAEPDARERLLQRCEGWAAGLVLSTLDGATGAASPQDEDLFRYLANEVYQRAPDELQDFLRRSSVLYELTPESGAGALGMTRAKATLQSLCESLQFVSGLEGGQVYRYHSLFRSFLVDRLREDPDEFREVHRLAGRYFADKRNWEAALFHFAQAGCAEEAAAVVEQAAPEVYDAGRWRMLADWIDDLPVGALETHPVLLVYRARVAVQLGQADVAMQYCSRAQEAVLAGASWLLPQIHVARAAAFRLQGLLGRCIEESEAAIALLPAPAERAVRLTLAEALHYKGIGLWQSGALREAIPVYKAALEHYRELGDLYRISFAHLNLGSACRKLGQHAEAMGHYSEAVRGWRQLGNNGQLASTLNSLGNLYRERDLALAEKTLREAATLAQASGMPLVRSYTLTSLAHVLSFQGKYTEAGACYEQGLEAAQAASERPEMISGTNGLALLHLVRGDAERAYALIEQAAGLAEPQTGSDLRGQVLVTQGAVCMALGQMGLAGALLNEAGGLLTEQGSRDIQARLGFQLACLKWRQADPTLNATLARLAAQLSEPGSELPLLLEARLATPLVRHAAGLPQIGDCFRRLLDALGRFQPETSPGPAGSHAAVALPAVRAYCFGQARAEIEDAGWREARWTTEKSKEMFFYLLVNGPWAYREAIIEALWPDATRAKGDTLLWATTYRLRRSLYQESVVRNEENKYGLNPDGSFWLDAHEFQELLKGTGQNGDSPGDAASIAEIERALGLYDGPFLPALYSEWGAPVRDRLQDRFLAALLVLAGAYVEQGALDRAVELCDRALQADSYLEDAHFVKIKALAGAGRRPEADRAFNRYVAVVQNELGGEPNGKFVELRQRMRAG